jgi:hypothetical protein
VVFRVLTGLSIVRSGMECSMDKGKSMSQNLLYTFTPARSKISWSLSISREFGLGFRNYEITAKPFKRPPMRVDAPPYAHTP